MLTVDAALPIIVAGVACGIAAVHKEGTPHLNDTHKKWGVAIFVLYFAQIALGGIIHFFKIPALARKGVRAPQNYFHAIFGIFIIGISFYQVGSHDFCSFQVYSWSHVGPDGLQD